MSEGSVTILIPVYNRGKLIRNCLQSVCGQVYENIKILVVDDASTDNTVDVVKEFMDKDPRVHLKQHSVNSGSQSKAMTEAISECDTEFFTWLGSDDEYIPSSISQFVAQMRKYPDRDYISCDLKMVAEGEQPCSLCNSSWPQWNGFYSVDPFAPYSVETYTRCIYNSLCPPFPWNGMWRMSFFKKNKLTWITYQDNTWSPDTLNSLHFFRHGLKVMHYTEFPLIKYNIHEGQDTKTGAIGEQIRCDVTLINAIFEWFSTKVFLDKELSAQDRAIEYLLRLKRLIVDHTSRHPTGLTILEKAVEDVAVNALVFAWDQFKYNIPKKPETEGLLEFFKSKVGHQ
jgi:glycosyltransferase involved in cell wall biosynthesis